MTMKELAALANVSVSAVSKAFSGAEDISEETKNHIFSIAKENGCYTKFYKGKYSKPIIAIVCPEILGSLYSDFVDCLKHIIEENGGIVLISTDNFDRKSRLELIEYYSEYLQVDGIIVFNMCEAERDFSKPIVSVFDSRDKNVEAVKLDFAPAIGEAIMLFKGLGHKCIAFAGEERTKGKEDLFCEKCAEHGVEGVAFESPYRFEMAGDDCAKRILAAKEPITAVLCAYDDIAFGVIKHFKKNGYTVPNDFSVIGIDNISVSEYMETSLTSIDDRKEALCQDVWQLLTKKMKNKYYKSKKQKVHLANLIIRESVGRAKEKNI